MKAVICTGTVAEYMHRNFGWLLGLKLWLEANTEY